MLQDRRMICAIVRDMTEHKRAEEPIRESQARYKQLWDDAPVAYHTIDARGLILHVNQTEADMLGYTKEEMVGKPIFDFVLPEQRKEAKKRFRLKLAGEPVPKDLDRIYVRKNGSKIYVSVDDGLEHDSAGKVVGVRTTMVDVSERKRAEVALRESEERYRAVVETAADGFWMLDGQGRILATNNAYARRSGYSREQLLSMGIADVEADEDTAAVRRRMDHVRHLGSETFATRHRTRNGTVWPVEVHASYWESAGEYYFAFLHDMSERMALERAIIEASTAEQERIGRDIHDGLGQTLTGLSILAKVEELRLRQAGEQQAADAVGMLQQHIRAALDQARAMARGLRPVEVAPDGLAYALANLAEQVTRTGGVDCRYLGLPHLAVEGEVVAMHLFRIAQEAAQNALKHAQATRIEFDLRRAPEGLLLTVRDDGRGMDPDAEHGDGMGLKIMRYRANILGGHLTIGADPYRGTLVRCVVPLRR